MSNQNVSARDHARQTLQDARPSASGSEEQGTGGLGRGCRPNANLLRADAICVVDTGDAELGRPTLSTSLRGETTVDLTLRALDGALLHDDHGNTTVDGLGSPARGPGASTPQSASASTLMWSTAST